MGNFAKFGVGFVLLIAASESLACGGVAHAFHRMKLETDPERLEAFLQTQTCSEELHFFPELADRPVFAVLKNAAAAGVSVDLFERVLTRFNCVAKLADQPDYRVIMDYVKPDRFAALCAPEALARVYIVQVTSGANLRATPSIRGAKVGAVQFGAIALEGEVSGEWIKVRTYMGEGYMHESTLRKYL